MNEAKRSATQTQTELHRCGECGSDLVQPTRWEQGRQRGFWKLWRRCPECEWTSVGTYGEREIDAYDEALDDGADALACELEELEREVMRELAESFATALRADLITAEDFA